jgi:hypothetical protein
MVVSVLGIAGDVLAGDVRQARIAERHDVIATVSQPIRFSELTSKLDKGTVPGVPRLSVPDYGTPKRKRIIERMLEYAIQTEVLYLDALRKGVNHSPAYRAELEHSKQSVLAGLFRDRWAQTLQLRQKWRNGLAITLRNEALYPAGDAVRSDGEVLATVAATKITWGEAGPGLLAATRRAGLSEGASDVVAERWKVLEQLIDVSVLALRAREHGLEQDPAYLERVAELEKASLRGFHYRQLAADMSPTDKQIEAYAAEHADQFPVQDEKARRAIKKALIARGIGQYVDGLKQAFRVTVDEARLDRLLARQAEEAATKGRNR